MTKSVTAIVAHPDDEILGAGGALSRHAHSGESVHVIFLTDGVGARGGKKGGEARRLAAQEACATIGVKQENIHFYNFPDNKMDSLSLLDVVQTLEKKLQELEPRVIYTHHAGDLNIDHRITHQAVLTACRPQLGSSVTAIYGFEILSSTEWATPEAQTAFIPSFYIDISEYFDIKMKALRSYDMEMRPFPHSRSYEAIEALATLRGAHVGMKKAEAFTVIRQLKR